MRLFILIALILSSCQVKTNNTIGACQKFLFNDSTNFYHGELAYLKRKAFLDELYTCECENYYSILEEVPGADSNAYRITITSKDGNWKKSELINTRPEMSRILFCTDFYTAVSFACGGPCHAAHFIFIEDDRPNEVYGFVYPIKNNDSLITYIRYEEFETIIIRNMVTSKEIEVDASDSYFGNYGIMDSTVYNDNFVTLYYSSKELMYQIKKVNVKRIMK